MKFGVKLIDSVSINHFIHIVSTVSKLCAKAANDKSCVLKLTQEMIYFILPEFSTNNSGNGGIGRTSFWMSIDPKSLFDFYISEGKSADENLILLEIQPETLLRTLKSSTNLKMIRIKLTKRQSACLTVELDLHSISSKTSSRTITHDIPIKVISTAKLSMEDFQEPNVNRATLSIQLPSLKLLKHMIERMKCLSEFIYLEATNRGTLTLKIDTDAVQVCSYFRNLNNLPVGSIHNRTTTSSKSMQRSSTHVADSDEEEEDQDDRANREQSDMCTVRLSLKRLNEFVNALQFQPSKMICNFVNNRYAHFFVVHDDDLVLQYLISSVLS
jgi:HUS1 checkpoint protein